MARKDGEALQSLPRKKLNSGSSEIRMWISIGGAVEHLDMAWSHYVPGYRTPAGSGTGLGFAYLVVIVRDCFAGPVGSQSTEPINTAVIARSVAT